MKKLLQTSMLVVFMASLLLSSCQEEIAPALENEQLQEFNIDLYHEMDTDAEKEDSVSGPRT
ncbi:hypothetical protein [Roseivirga seohaensis]|uniref:hypothetical protein n=1 Tax=Roseivirga seohaensis TaxID=1914963 RepID=UPI003BAD1A69